MNKNKNLQDWLNQPIHMHYITTIIAVAEDLGLEQQALFSEAGIDDAVDLSQPQSNLSLLMAIGNAFALHFGDRPVGLEVGWNLPPTTYGNLGYVLLCCDTLLQSLGYVERFWPLVNRSASGISFQQVGDYAEMTLHVSPLLTGPYRRVWIEASLASWKRCLEIQLTHSAPTEMEFNLRQSTWPCKLDEKYGAVKYGCEANKMRLPMEYMLRALPMANPTSLHIAVKQCELDLVRLGETEVPLTTRVQNMMVSGREGYPSLEQLAEKLHMSPRTLRRRLMVEGCGYKDLLDRCRHNDALHLLGSTDQPIQKVAETLGYTNPANFARAFRLWTGQTPSQYRNRSGQ